MKKPRRAILVAAVSVAVIASFAYTLRRLRWESDFGRPWNIDVEASVSGIERVPDQFANRYSSLDDYKNYVRRRARGLTLTIYENGTATLRQSGSRATNLVWRKGDTFDYWLNTRNSWLLPVATMGHGFDRVSARTARLKFQLEWDENQATREFLVLRR